ncbi:MAG: hypothetical protein M3Q49_13300 [Actinomycetota bacterium]|nr:hypothetical protein [Actinomycetota bacterium]
MKRKTAVLFAVVLVFAPSSLGAAACGGSEDGAGNPVREATRQIEGAREVKQQVEKVQQQRAGEEP